MTNLLPKIFYPITSLYGVGDKLSGFLARLAGGKRIVDLIYHKPSHFNQKKFLPNFPDLENKDLIIANVQVESHIKPSSSRAPFKVRCFSASGYLTLVFFKTFPNYIEKNFAIGSHVAVSGIVERFSGELQMNHPDYVFPADQINKIPRNEIIYPTIGAFSQKFLRVKIASAIACVEDFPEWIDEGLMRQENWPSWKNSILNLHQNPSESSRRRLAFDELLAMQIANQIAKKYLKTKSGKELVFSENLRQKLIAILPFKLTLSQEKVLAEIDSDLTSSKKMLRLLQGDVGSGKTIVAFLAMLLAAENKKQAVIICPITLLAFQHYRNFSVMAEKIGIKIALLTSKTPKKSKQKILEDLKNGEIDILIGTHSLIEPDVVFKDLAIAVIDEQHRFGVLQRMKLVEKGDKVDVLLMSATPIPRSLMMAFYGDMDISSLNEKPKDRLEIDTRVISQNKEEEVLAAISRAVKNGEKIYWICPLIEESEQDLESEKCISASYSPSRNDGVGNSSTHLPAPSSQESTEKKEILTNNVPAKSLRGTIHGESSTQNLDSKLGFAKNSDSLNNVSARFEQFKKLFGEERTGLIHGKMKEKEKDQIMNNFMKGETQILVSTTVIEVGIDVPDATIIVIDNPENFGLSALHQLRGRVGRGAKQSFCILLYGKKVGINGKKRLAIMKNSNDGFFIADEDLKLRGGGHLVGTRQSGLPTYKMANLETDLDLMKISLRASQILLEKDLTFEDKEKIRNLLRIFDLQECFKIVFGG